MIAHVNSLKSIVFGNVQLAKKPVVCDQRVSFSIRAEADQRNQ